MIEFHKFTLDNGLRVLFHNDPTTPLATVNTLYDVGARDENPARTGFAHLFEHLMFSGSIHIPKFDIPLQQAGGNNNAFTTNDLTNYYDTLPVQNIETALWLESDRMLSLAFTPKSLEVQRDVVIEEFKQRYLNQPYGDLWLEFRPLAYTTHPYQWATIGKNIDHIKDATMEEVKFFFEQYYHPGNAILSIVGNCTNQQIEDMVSKWYGSIPHKPKKERLLPVEPEQKEFRKKVIERDVPSDLYVYGFKMPGKTEDGFYAADLLSDVLGRGKTSRLYKRLKNELEWVTDINTYTLGSFDTGLLITIVQPDDGCSFQQIDAEIWSIFEELKHDGISENEYLKIINKVKTTNAFSIEGALDKAMGLASYELLGDANLINEINSTFESVSISEIEKTAKKIMQKSNCSLLHVKAKKK